MEKMLDPSKIKIGRARWAHKCLFTASLFIENWSSDMVHHNFKTIKFLIGTELALLTIQLI